MSSKPNKLVLIYPYYNAPMMLQTHLFNWAMIPDSVKKNVTIIVVDDGSQEGPALPVIMRNQPIGFDLRLYRVKVDIPWNQHGCRNLGVRVAPDGCWLFLSDIDHTLPADQIVKLISYPLDKRYFYTVERMTASMHENGNIEYEIMTDSMGRPKPHPNTFLVTKSVFWRAGGYDEDYCGCYGGDGPFRRWLDRSAKHGHLSDIHVVRWPRDIIPDASMQPEMREKYKPLYRPIFESKGGGASQKPTDWIRFPWERLL